MEKKIEYSIIVPVFNGERYLNLLHKRISKTFKNITENYEIIFVDDGSLDNSWRAMLELYKKNQKIKIIKLSRNYGQHNATLCGLRNSKGEYILTLDQDLQHPPEEIPKLIEEIKKGYFLVYGRYKSKKHGWFRNFGSLLTNKLLSKIAGSDFKITSFRIIKKEVVPSLDNFDNPNLIIDILFFQVISNREIGWRLVSHHPNYTNKSNYNFFKLLNISANMILNYTIAPLRIASIFGVLFSALGFGIALFYLIRYFLGYTNVSGFTAIIAAISFFSGFILLILGIIGEYLGRIFITINKKPQYKIKQIKN